jgi:hypothetical protein
VWTTKSGQESFQVWLQRHAQGFVEEPVRQARGQSELRQGIRVVNARIREERRSLTNDTRQMPWVDWLQQQATNGRSDALEALRVGRGRDQALTMADDDVVKQVSEAN